MLARSRIERRSRPRKPVSSRPHVNFTRTRWPAWLIRDEEGGVVRATLTRGLRSVSVCECYDIGCRRFQRIESPLEYHRRRFRRPLTFLADPDGGDAPLTVVRLPLVFYLPAAMLDSLQGESWARVVSLIDIHGTAAKEAAAAQKQKEDDAAHAGHGHGHGKKKASEPGHGDTSRMKEVLLKLKEKPLAPQ